MTEGTKARRHRGTKGFGRLLIGVAIALLAAGCEQNSGNIFSQASPAGAKAPMTPTMDANIVRVNKFFSSDPWLSFTGDGSSRIDGVRFTVYLEGGLQNKGVFGTGTIVVTMFRLDRDPTGREAPTQVFEWELPPDKAYPWRAKIESALGWGYGLRLGWDPKLDVEGKQIAFIVKYIREDRTAIISSRKVLKVPVQDGAQVALNEAVKNMPAPLAAQPVRPAAKPPRKGPTVKVKLEPKKPVKTWGPAGKP